MHFTLAAIALAASSLLPGAHANFDIYRVKDIRPYAQGGTRIIWQTFPAQPSCDEALNGGYYNDAQDVSGNKIGVRCWGSGCAQQAPIDGITGLEMHFSNSPLWHWTIYKDRGYSMVGLDGKTYGNCIPFPNGDFNCPFSGGSSTLEGRRKFRCLTSQIGST
ncbi:hypothetical protein QBC37DRAFT_322456 [Rhypophila decipiens]|uniref:Uncharacterized protein n=1 Tax=Rhypophila decipiens TaxID=261697 RepID=A0AAN6Y6F6_9PEZI|nr:hypothetical protein QBC37DRAFT_322456 [Rhypophila decipiens]